MAWRDGVRMVAMGMVFWAGSGWAEEPVPVATLPEVVMGPASVLYGSDAVGGALNAWTLAPPESTF